MIAAGMGHLNDDTAVVSHALSKLSSTPSCWKIGHPLRPEYVTDGTSSLFTHAEVKLRRRLACHPAPQFHDERLGFFLVRERGEVTTAEWDKLRGEDVVLGSAEYLVDRFHLGLNGAVDGVVLGPLLPEVRLPGHVVLAPSRPVPAGFNPTRTVEAVFRHASAVINAQPSAELWRL